VRCRHCGAGARVLETRTRGDSCKARRYECEGPKRHRYTTLEVPESVAKAVGAPWQAALRMADRGLEQRAERLGQRAAVESLLGTATHEAIAARVGCSLWLVADTAQTLAGGGRKNRAKIKAKQLRVTLD